MRTVFRPESFQDGSQRRRDSSTNPLKVDVSFAFLASSARKLGGETRQAVTP